MRRLHKTHIAIIVKPKILSIETTHVESVILLQKKDIQRYKDEYLKTISLYVYVVDKNV